MKVKPIKIKIKQPTPSAADRLHAQHQAIRKAKGLPDPSEYKKKLDSMKEEVEQLDELSPATKSSYVSKAKEQIKQAEPWTKKGEYKDLAKNIIAKRKKGIAKMSEELEEQLEKKGRFVSGPIKQPFKSNTIVTSVKEDLSDKITILKKGSNIRQKISSTSYDVFKKHGFVKEAKDAREYDYEGDMAQSQLRSLLYNAQDLHDMLEENSNLPEWLQSKITLAEDYISTAANYMRSELSEAVSPAQQAAIAINMKKKGIKPKGMKEEVKRYVPSPHGTPVDKKPKDEYARKVDKYLKKKYNKEEVELSEGRPSQRHPLEGHEYHKKSDEALVHIAKDAHAAAEAMKGHNTAAENKYRDQANDSATVRYYRKKHGMADWYKKKYGHVKEEVEQLDEKNVPTSPEKWARAKAQAKSKFDVYPSAYANGWAAKKYKEMGGGWKSVSEEAEEPSMAARTLSRRAQIVKDAAKGKKDKDEGTDKFQKDPELSSDIQKT